MPRRIPDYPDAFIFWNTVSSYGSFVSLVSVTVFIMNSMDIIRSPKLGIRAEMYLLPYKGF